MKSKKYKNIRKFSLEESSVESQESPKTAKKVKKSFVKKTLNAVFTTVQIAVYAAGATVLVGEASQIVQSAGKVKSHQTVLEDAKTLKVDTDMITVLGEVKPFMGSKTNKFPHNGSDPIFVSFSENISEEHREIYRKAFNYYEDLFSTIDSRYRFKEVSETETFVRKVIGQSVITFDHQNIEVAHAYNRNRNNLFKWDLIRDTSIVMDVESTANEEDLYSIIVHEIAHSFGFGDGHYANRAEIQSDTLMYGSNFNIKLGMFYPNDIKALHALYNKNITNKDGTINFKEVEKINQYIKEYEKEFYQKAKEALKQIAYKDYNTQTVNPNNAKKQIFHQSYVFRSSETHKAEKATKVFEIDYESNKVNFKVLDKDDNMVYQTQTDIFVMDDIVFIPSLTFEKGKVLNNDPNMQNKYGDMFFAITKINNDYVVVDIAAQRSQHLKQVSVAENRFNSNQQKTKNVNSYDMSL